MKFEALSSVWSLDTLLVKDLLDTDTQFHSVRVLAHERSAAVRNGFDPLRQLTKQLQYDECAKS